MADINEAQFQSLDALFGASLDDIADLASFETPKTGSYLLKVSMESKIIDGNKGKKPAVMANFEVLETVELKDPEDPVSKNGTKFNIMFMLGNSISEGRLKQFLSPFAEKFQEKNVGVLVRDMVQEVVISAYVTNRADKDDPEKIYAGIKNVVVD